MRTKAQIESEMYSEDADTSTYTTLMIEMLLDIRDTLMGIFLMLKREDDRKKEVKGTDNP